MLKKLIAAVLSTVTLLTSTYTAFATDTQSERFRVKLIDEFRTMCMYDNQTGKYYVKCTKSLPERGNSNRIPEGYFTDMTGDHCWEEWKIPDNFYDSQDVMFNGKIYQIFANNKKVGAYLDGELDEKLTQIVEMAWDSVKNSNFVAGGFENVTRIVFMGTNDIAYIYDNYNAYAYIEMAGKIFPASIDYDSTSKELNIEDDTWYEDETEYDITTLIGDASMDGAFDMTDVTTTQKHLASIKVECNTILSDVNEDGIVNLKDVVSMQKTIAGIG